MKATAASLALVLLSTPALGKSAPQATAMAQKIADLQKQVEELTPGLGETMG
jgi:hypothetical protein